MRKVYMRLKLQAIVAAISGLLLPVMASAASVNDDFNDNTIGSQWTTVTDSPATLNLAEQNQRLEALSSGPSSVSTDALYLSTFRVSTASDFQMTIDYSFAHYQSIGSLLDTFGLDFGVGTDAGGSNSAAVAFGYLNNGTATPTAITSVGYRNGGSQTLIPLSPTGPSFGTFSISYDSATDVLTLGQLGGSPSEALAATVHGKWNASDLLVSFGARGDGFTTASGDAYLDNFTLVSGTVTPEPACLTGIGIASSALLGRRRRPI